MNKIDILSEDLGKIKQFLVDLNDKVERMGNKLEKMENDFRDGNFYFCREHKRQLEILHNKVKYLIIFIFILFFYLLGNSNINGAVEKCIIKLFM